jgi:hypothetical protein
MALLLWYAIVYTGLILGVRRVMPRPKKMTQRNFGKEYLQTVKPWCEPIPGWEDSIFYINQDHATHKTP